jgi:hypothetical protein
MAGATGHFWDSARCTFERVIFMAIAIARIVRPSAWWRARTLSHAGVWRRDCPMPRRASASSRRAAMR